MKLKIILYFLSIVSFFSCKEKEIKGVVIDTEVNLFIQNSKGQNLLDSATPGYYNPDSIKIYYLKNGKKEEVFNPKLTFPRNFLVEKNKSNDQHFIKIFLNEGTSDKEVTTTYIEWNKNREDTIKSLMTRSSSSLYSDKVWYNEVLKYEWSKTAGNVDWGNETFRRLIKITS